jgi:hypothetical protein
MIESDPATATALAYQNGDATTVAAALEAWKELDPFSAAVWVNDVKNAQLQQQIDERLQSATGPLHQRAANQQFEETLANFARLNPDVDQYLGTMQEVASESPMILGLLKSDATPEAITEVFDFLYSKARARDTGRLTEQEKVVAQEEAEKAEAEKQSAAVASATSTVAAGGKSNVDIFKEEMLKPPAYRA